MRVGVCCSPELAKLATSSGAEYVELPAYRMATEPGYLDAIRDLPVEATNLFFSSDMRLYENEGRSVKNAEKTIRRAHAGGLTVLGRRWGESRGGRGGRALGI